MASKGIIADYLVIGAGMAGLAFVDELLTQTESTIVIVDKRAAPGGHWIDSYPFVKLHQPSSSYGVNSLELSNGLIDETGFNKGLGDLASGPEVTAYCSRLMRERFLRTHRVTFLPLTEYTEEGGLREVLSGRPVEVHVNKRVVDATAYTADIPLNHIRPFQVDGAVTCIPPNDLPRYASSYEHFTVLGGGKTGVDAMLWLRQHGVGPERQRWIVPGEYWYLNRGTAQPDSFQATATLLEEFGKAENADNLAQRMEDAEIWMRLDSTIEPKQFHYASLTPIELVELRKTKDIVRKGHVKLIEPHQMTLVGGVIEAKPNTLYIDCTASALAHYKPLVPVFQPGKIVLQLIRSPWVGYSAAKSAFLESLPMSDQERNEFAKPLRFSKTIEEFISVMDTDLSNRLKEASDPTLAEWMKQSRIEGVSYQASKLKPEQTDLLSAVEKFGPALVAAAQNISKLAKSTEFQQPKDFVPQVKAGEQLVAA